MHHQKVLRPLSALLCALTLVTALPLSRVSAEDERRIITRKPTDQSEKSAMSENRADISVRTLRSYAKDYNVSGEFLDEISALKSITRKQLQQYAQEFGLPAQYVQRFFTDCFVFKSGNRLEYVPIDSKLPKNSYNWKHLVKSGTEYQYIVDGVSKAKKGIDVSEFQGRIDWKKVKADGVDFAFIRAGYRGYGTGKIMEDSRFQENVKNAAAAGVKVGIYFYSQATSTREAVEEANFTLKLIKGKRISYPVVYDVEAAPSANARTTGLSAQQSTQAAAAFCDTVKKAGYHPMIYSYTKYFVDDLQMSKLTKYDKWLAQYYVVPFFPYKFQILQYSSTGRVNGIKGNVDMNLSFHDYARVKNA